jgi:hypothetical protein
MHRLILLCAPLAMASRAEAHLSHSTLSVHEVEHLSLLVAFLISVLLLVRPVKRIFARIRKQQV